MRGMRTNFVVRKYYLVPLQTDVHVMPPFHVAYHRPLVADTHWKQVITNYWKSVNAVASDWQFTCSASPARRCKCTNYEHHNSDTFGFLLSINHVALDSILVSSN